MTPHIKTAALVISPTLFMCAILLLVFWPLAVLGVGDIVFGGELYPAFWALFASNVVGFFLDKWKGDVMSYIRAAFLLAAYNIFAVGIAMLFGLPFRWSVVIAANVYLAAMAAVLWYAQRGE